VISIFFYVSIIYYLLVTRMNFSESEYNTKLASGRVLEGKLVSPQQTQCARGFIVLLHGMASHCDHSFAPALARSLCLRFSCHVVRFTARGPTSDPLEPSFRYRICGFEDDLQDLMQVIESCSLFGPLLAIIGHSRGANVSLLFASRDKSSTQIVAVSPRFHMREMLEGRMFSNEQRSELSAGSSIYWSTKVGTITVLPEDVATLACLDMGAVVASIKTGTKICIIHGTNDTTIPHADALAYAAAPKECNMNVISMIGAKHNFEGRHEELITSILGSLQI